MPFESDILRALDELEAVVGNVKGGFLGKRIINEKNSSPKLDSSG